jgi:hypothetical protein
MDGWSQTLQTRKQSLNVWCKSLMWGQINKNEQQKQKQN